MKFVGGKAIIAYEGKTDKDFLEDFLKFCELKREAVTFYNFEGKGNFFNTSYREYDTIKKSLNIITKILLIVDADKEYKHTEEKLKKVIKDLDFNIDIDYYIMCDENQEGNLESFLLSVLDDKQKKCINELNECYELTDKWVYNSLYKQKKYSCNFSHSNFNDLKKKLKNLYKGL